jgi:hypothetical protein
MRTIAPDDQHISAPPGSAKLRVALGCARVARSWAQAAYRRLRADPELCFVTFVGSFVFALFVVEQVLGAHDAPTHTVTVDSVPLEQNYSLAEWTLEKAESGYLDSITFAGARLDSNTVQALADSETISLHGWAGDTDLGMRFAHVVFSMCDRVIGNAKVGIARPDVARQVHPNLGSSGWAAKLLVGHLPRCDGARLAAWAVSPFGRTLYPLQGGASLALAPPGKVAGGTDASPTVTSAELVHPSDIDAAARPIVVDVKSGSVNLRRCGAVSCTAIGTLGRGRHSGVMLDGNGEWTLVLIRDLTIGWISREAAHVTQAAR